MDNEVKRPRGRPRLHPVVEKQSKKKKKKKGAKIGRPLKVVPIKDTPPSLVENKVLVKPLKIFDEELDLSPTPSKHMIQPPAMLEELLPRQMRFIEYYSLGFSVLESAVACGFQKNVKNATNKQLYVNLIHSIQGKEYYRQLQAEYRERNYVVKDQLVRELLQRLPNSSTKDLVSIVGMLNKMYGFNQEIEIQQNNTQINIGWSDDPWIKAREDHTIDVTSEVDGKTDE